MPRTKTERNDRIWDFYQKGYRYVAIARMFKMKVSTVGMVISRESKRRGVTLTWKGGQQNARGSQGLHSVSREPVESR